jgi:hypothetical protein
VKIRPITDFFTAVRKLREDQRDLVMTMFDLHLKARLSARPNRMIQALGKMYLALKAIEDRDTGNDDLYSNDGEMNKVLSMIKDDRQRKDTATGLRRIREENQAYADRRAKIPSAKFKEEWESTVGTRPQKEKILSLRHGVKQGTIQRRVSRLRKAGKLTN